MKIIETDIKGLYIIEPSKFEDERGHFCESYSKAAFLKEGIDIDFVQDNQSLSKKDVIRGMHFQTGAWAQDKLVRVAKGSVIDVAIDLRPKSPTYGDGIRIFLSEENGISLLIPKGFAHGFASLEDGTVFQYKCSNFYNKDSESGIIYNDTELNINWGIENPIVSEKDLLLGSFREFEMKNGH